MRTLYFALAVVLVLVTMASAAYAQQNRTVEVGSSVAGAILGPLICGFVAYSKGRNPWGWALFGFFCCPLALLILLFSAPAEPQGPQY